MNLLKLIKDYVPSIFKLPAIQYVEAKVGAGFYALRENISAAGKRYTKLVKANRSGAYQHVVDTDWPVTQPLVGKRSDKPLKRRARCNVQTTA